jgi:molybdopterin-guanine dinucleotide biosynthesis protein A
MNPHGNISGLILAGGQGRRMQGLEANTAAERVEKGLIQLHGQPLVAHAHRYLAPQVDEILISANRHLDVYATYGRVVTDDPELGADLGPLAGLAAVLTHVATPWLLVIPVDVMGLPDNLGTRLLAAATLDGGGLAYARAGQAQPLCALIHARHAPGLRRYLQAGERRVQDWMGRNAAVAVDFPADPASFLNINTPQDLRQVQDQASQCNRS